MEIVIGMLGALVGVGLFIFGFHMGKELGSPKVRSSEAENTDEDMAKIREERDRLIQEQKAFRELMNYNSDTAYGLTADPFAKERSG